MADRLTKVLIVDDMLDNRTLLEFLLEDKYEVKSAESGQECLDIIGDYQPEVVLLDVRMPDMDGYEVCKQLKAMEEFEKTPVIFVSAEEGVEEQLKGFRAGGDAYLIKPVDEDQLLTKIADCLKGVKEYRALEEEAQLAMRTAYEAMSSQSELGIIVRYMDRCSQCNSYNDVAVELLNTTKVFGLICSLQIRNDSMIFNVGNGCEEGSIEANLLSYAVGKGKFIEYGKRLILNACHISILVKNMPFEDESAYGRYKDHLTMLLNVTDNRVKSIGLEISIEEQRQTGLKDAVHMTQQDLEKMTVESKQNGDNIRALLSSMRSEIESTLFGLGLTEDQEVSILGQVDEILDQFDVISSKAEEIDDGFKQISQRFHQLIDSN